MLLENAGITTAKIKQFNEKGIETVEDLLRFFPKEYADFSNGDTGILPPEKTSCLIVKIYSVKEYQSRIHMIKAFGVTAQTEQKVNITWFCQKYKFQQIKMCEGKSVFVAGKVTFSDAFGYAIKMPEVFDDDITEAMRIYPKYSKIAGMSDEYLKKTIFEFLNCPEYSKELLPTEILTEYHLCDTKRCLEGIHVPKTQEDIKASQKRVLFDDMLEFALSNENERRNALATTKAIVRPNGVEKQKTFIENLPFKLTKDQNAVIEQLTAGMQTGQRVHALVQGDVGSGKTVVAIALAVAMTHSGNQCVIVAPTQILAKQHYDNVKETAGYQENEIVFVSGGEKVKERREKLQRIGSGEAKIIIGTHAVFSADMLYKNLGLVIIDEEHKFGVAQRQKISRRALTGPHCISMSATPIPRSLAQTIYGSTVEVFAIETMPEGRKPVRTLLIHDRKKFFGFVKNEVENAHQIFVVCPAIDEGGKMTSVEQIEKEYSMAFANGAAKIATLTGKDKKEHADATIQQFANGEIDILIATTVIEVGVNIPNATMMVISGAERFGLSTLHQLRGRVGRGNLQSYCVLDGQPKTDTALKRFSAMLETTDGFEIAKKDLEIRGAGDLFGTKQSGMNKFIMQIIAFPNKYQIAKRVADRMLDEFPENEIVKKCRTGGEV